MQYQMSVGILIIMIRRLQDGPKNVWEPAVVSRALSRYVRMWGIETVYEYDDVRVLCLRSLHLMIMVYLDIQITLLPMKESSKNSIALG
jgi:hypothetical protein